LKVITDWKKISKIFVLAVLVIFFINIFSNTSSAKNAPFAEDIKPLFSDFLQACTENNHEKAVTTIKALEQWEVKQGFFNTPALSKALLKVYKNSPLYSTESRGMRLAVLEGLCRLSPDSPFLQWLVIKGHLIARPFDVYNLIKRIGYLIHAMKLNLKWTLSKGGKLLVSLMLTLLLVSISFSLMFLLKYFSYMVFYVKRFVKFTLNNVFAVLVTLMILLLPVYVNIGFAWMPLFWMALMWLLFTKGEKMVVMILFITFFMMSFALGTVSKVLVAKMNQNAELLYLANYEQIDPVSYARLKYIADNTTTDSEVLFTLGLIAKRRGAYEDALAYYMKAIKTDAVFPECMNNLGNVYLLMKRRQPNFLEKARDWYQKAIKVDPKRAEFYYNLSKSYPESRQERMEYIVKSRNYNPNLINRLTKAAAENAGQILVDCAISPKRLWKRAFKESDISRNIFLLIWRFFLHTSHDDIFVAPIVLIGIILFFSLFYKKVELAVPCERCGQLFFRTVPAHYANRVCHQCQLIQQKGIRAGPEKISKKEREITRYRRKMKILKIVFGVFPVGGRFILGNSPFLALGLSVPFYFFLSVYLAGQHILPAMPFWFCCEVKSGLESLLLAGILYAVSLGIALFKFIRSEES